MFAYTYDGTFGGLLSVVFDCYQTNREPMSITKSNCFSLPLFAQEVAIVTNEIQAQRVWDGLNRRSEQSSERIYRVFLTEDPSVPMLLYQYIRLVFASSVNIDDQLANPVVLNIDKQYRSMLREAHRALMFIRFQKLKDGTWFAPYEPKYNVLPLVTDHFADRLADQQWMIYDTARKYGFFYNTQTVQEVALSLDQSIHPSHIPSQLLDADELLYQSLWKDYYQATTIAERHNMKVHVQFLPKRFWKNLPEKR